MRTPIVPLAAGALLLMAGTLLLVPAPAAAQQPVFDEWFEDATMRVDFHQTGNAEEFFFSIDQIYRQGRWAGNPRRPVDDFNSGMYYVKVYSLASNRLIYARGFQTLFGEYQTTDPAIDGVMRSYLQTALIPWPKAAVRFVIEGRGPGNLLVPLFSARIDPGDVNIVREASDERIEVFEIEIGGDCHDMVDFALVAEGYTAAEKEKFRADAARMAEVLFSSEPFASHRSLFNIHAVFVPSTDSGVDEPRRGIFRRTALDGSFNALDLDRYLLIDNLRAMRDVAGAAPYDVLGVLVNSTRYGGGGIYGDYFVTTVDNQRSEYVFMHELGHHFANLADEYFTATVSYNEFFPEGQEPHEPNITRLLDPDNVKWKHLLTPGTPVPTPWGQDEIAALEARAGELRREMRTELARLEESGASERELERARQSWRDRIDEVMTEAAGVRRHYQELYAGKIGVFEGAGYSAKGIYRSEIHVGMFHEGSYGPVSEEAIRLIIEHLTGR